MSILDGRSYRVSRREQATRCERELPALPTDPLECPLTPRREPNPPVDYGSACHTERNAGRTLEPSCITSSPPPEPSLSGVSELDRSTTSPPEEAPLPTVADLFVMTPSVITLAEQFIYAGKNAGGFIVSVSHFAPQEVRDKLQDAALTQGTGRDAHRWQHFTQLVLKAFHVASMKSATRIESQ